MTNEDYWLVGILVFSYLIASWQSKPLARLGILWVCLWVGSARLGFITKQEYMRFVTSEAYRFNQGKEEQLWVMLLVLCSAGVLFMIVAPVVWFYREWRRGRKAMHSET